MEIDLSKKAAANNVFMPLWGLSLIINSFLKLTLSRWTLWTGRVCHAAHLTNTPTPKAS
jgi:hypothetical protein